MEKDESLLSPFSVLLLYFLTAGAVKKWVPRCMAPFAKIPENLLVCASFGAAPGTVPAGTAAGVQLRQLVGR